MTESLGARLKRKPLLVAPGVYDGFSALMVEQAGFEAAYLSGAAVAIGRFARPDIGLISMAEVADVIAVITDRVGLPLIVDADTGYGNALNVQRTVRTFERLGAAAIQLEDQTTPKRCGHLNGKTIVSAAEMVGKIKAAVDARRNEETLIVARTDAIAIDGLEAALERGEQFVEAGADVLFVEAPRTEEHLRQVTQRFAGKVPLLANMVEGGKTPVQSAEVLEDWGFALAIFPGSLLRAYGHTAQALLSDLKRDGTTKAWHNRMLLFDDINGAVGTPAMLELGRQYDADAQTGA